MEPLFDGHDNLFRAALDGATVYGEYGLGASTLWVDRHTSARIIGVETDPVWAEETRAQLRRNGHDIRHIDVGPVGLWGKPRSYRKRRRFIDYVEGPWRTDARPEAVLIDGRFRVACFLTSLLHASPGTILVFDDYASRRTYHIVEEVCPPEARNARQAAFVVPEEVDKAAIAPLRDQFLMVMD